MITFLLCLEKLEKHQNDIANRPHEESQCKTGITNFKKLKKVFVLAYV